MSDKTLSAEDLKIAKDNFEFTDTDGNGSIDYKEFASLLKVLSPAIGLEQTAVAFSMVDVDSDGQISYEEFLDWWQQVWWEY